MLGTHTSLASIQDAAVMIGADSFQAWPLQCQLPVMAILLSLVLNLMLDVGADHLGNFHHHRQNLHHLQPHFL